MMRGIHLIYSRSGEILTAITAFSLGAYLIFSLSGSSKILDNETRAKNIVKEIMRLENQSFNSAESGKYVRLKDIVGLSPLLQGLEEISTEGSDSLELFISNDYLYALSLEYEIRGAKDYITDPARDIPSGFKVMAWPAAFAFFGELAFYGDNRGKLAVTTNERALLDGLKSFPPDWKPASTAVEEDGKNKSSSPWRVDSSP